MKTLPKLIVFMLAPLVMASCKNAVKKEVLTKKWELASYTITMPEGLSYTDTVPADARSSYWTFGSDGTMRVDGNYDFDKGEFEDLTTSGTYTLSGNHLVISTGRISRSFNRPLRKIEPFLAKIICGSVSKTIFRRSLM